MRAFPLLALLVYLIPSLFILAAPLDGRKGIATVVVLEGRDEPTSTTTPDSSSDSTVATATGTATTTPSTTGTVSATSSSNSTTPASTTIASLNTSTASKNGTENESKHRKPGDLPLPPKITPALGVGGFVLIALGAVLALVGIRKIWVQVFLSTACLTSLGVTVLIVYVMNPPVRTAVQGAYLVAIVFTGITFGALSVVFKELTEGLGCLLGGFCLSMWLLSLKPGGLLTGTDAKSGFIGALSVAFYALSFSHYTRPYGLIVGTAISGGTAVALGIDCYSRAGLKEFWLYIWSLNDDIFPLGTNTYPVTRNIRVELAVTVIVALLGIVSQLRLWKVIRERRRNETKKREEEQRKNDEAEAEAGRRLEENNIRERAEWEAKFGNGEAKDIPELADESKRYPEMEVGDLEKTQEVEIESVATSQRSYRCSDCREREANGDAASDLSGASGDTQAPHHDDQDGEDGVAPENVPGETPLPFKVFDGAAAAKIKNDDESDATAIVGSDVGSIRSKRFSGMSGLRRMSVRSGYHNKLASQSQEALVASKDGDDSSSTQGVPDDDLESGSNRSSMLSDDQAKRNSAGGETVANGGDTKEPSAKDDAHQEQDDPKQKDSGEEKNAGRGTDQLGSFFTAEATAKEKQPNSKNGSQKDRAESQNQKDGSTPTTKEPESSPSHPEQENLPGEADSKETPETTQHNSEEQTGTGASDTKTTGLVDQRKSSGSKTKSKNKQKKEEKPVLNSETVKHIPERTSRVVQSYRTNEWAKHLSDAEFMDPEPIHPIEEDQPEVPVETEEPPAPVNVKELLQTPLNAQPPPAAIETRRVSIGKEPLSPGADRRMSSTSQLPQNELLPSNSMKHPRPGLVRSPTQRSGASSASSNYPRSPPLAAQSSQDLMNAIPSASNPFLPATAEANRVEPKWKGPPPLLAVREDMMRTRVSSTSLTIDPWLSRGHHRQSADATPTSPTFPIPEEGDNVPLSRRRAMLHRQNSQNPPAHVPQPARHSQVRTASPVNPHAVMAAWRESVREDLTQKQNPLGLQTPTSPIERTPSPFGQAQRNSSVNIGNAIAEGMQRGDMTDLHREAMRRMQASAMRRTPPQEE
ncbi:hypothetical protein ASPWEDRAFT_167560 [Aspergillus wentii DTO 134E9]|uniref:TM7S3/TM198-like domain-containing protein n=1 Tax=Aspergillus wentii DTO 134E9 TaxID=1073089 RepID=A0A1L9S305_ASPWE|nr:uncharacterized protein ASPWEDRAFT_167560 [Aspergillus wentii DTO 134E9]KAI9929894.1 hypothetical protein MW887_011704 [Aspergillus wentii]OJJ41545.1 hypothetical protein ASPWEDRAFT_167560 [Aspergillus wentii DTO 134E9]